MIDVRLVNVLSIGVGSLVTTPVEEGSTRVVPRYLRHRYDFFIFKERVCFDAFWQAEILYYTNLNFFLHLLSYKYKILGIKYEKCKNERCGRDIYTFW